MKTYFIQVIYGSTFKDYYIDARNEEAAANKARKQFKAEHNLTTAQAGFLRIVF